MAARSGAGLSRYREKRDFNATPEPRGRVSRSHRHRLAYYVQRHHARRLHYDFRLELNGTLKSWAVPKGPSLDPGEKRLAVQVEDHPLDYGSFEGEIPEGQYGAGKVLLWDRGVWIPQGDAEEGLRKGHLKFRLDGRKLAGAWDLVRIRSRDNKENWLLIKERDDAAKSGKAAAVVAQRPESVLNAPGDAAPLKPADLQGARKAAMYGVIKPQLATLTDGPPPGKDWLLEIKFDGYRALCRLERGKARLYTRAGNDWTRKWQAVAEASRQLPADQAWLDGEIVAVGPDGRIDFQLLQNMDTAPKGARLAYYVFDLLYLDGYDLRRAPLQQRKQLLRHLLGGEDARSLLRYSDHLRDDPETVFRQACAQGLEGVIAKRAGAHYESRRSRGWLKVKCLKRQEFVIGGYTDPRGGRSNFGALLLGVQDDQGSLRYAGKVGTGFDDASLKRLHGLFQKRPADKAPFVNPPRGREAAGVHWLRPELVAEVKFAQWTEDGIIRHSAFVGLREDKPPGEVRRETAQPVSARKVAPPSSSAHPHSFAGIRLTNPTRVLYPEIGMSKQALAAYYHAVCDWIMPHLVNRPLTLVRCPKGVGQHCFFQKHANTTTAPALTRVPVTSKGKTKQYMSADNPAALLTLVQMGVLEIHTWGSRRQHLEKPDRITFDLDPAPGLAWPRVIEAALLLKALLDEIGLASFVKTTGGKGLHVVIPIKPERNWDQVKNFSRAIAYHMARILPDRFTPKMTKSSRGGRTYIDYLRNDRDATVIAAYSTRARPGAPVSVPLAWEELSEDIHSDSFTVTNLRGRLQDLRRDPWADYFSTKQRISAKMLKDFAGP